MVVNCMVVVCMARYQLLLSLNRLHEGVIMIKSLKGHLINRGKPGGLLKQLALSPSLQQTAVGMLDGGQGQGLAVPGNIMEAH